MALRGFMPQKNGGGCTTARRRVGKKGASEVLSIVLVRHYQYCKVTATAAGFNLVMNDVNEALMCFDAIHQLTVVRSCVSRKSGRHPLTGFMYSP